MLIRRERTKEKNEERKKGEMILHEYRLHGYDPYVLLAN